jgi:Rps23 Pro-64 3,4-dihydroxylase Tpa1-like proline 4-hydroxylase
VTPYCRFVDVFGDQANRELYRLALVKRPAFTRSKTSPSKHYTDWRRSTVIYDHQLTGATARLDAEVRARLPDVLRALGIPAFPVASLEIQLTSHNDGEYYKTHADCGTPDTAGRVVTFVYYFHGAPKRFSGGELVLHGPDGHDYAVEPENDTIVFFNSRTMHEVRPVVCPSRAFEDGRFTLNGWVRRPSQARRDDYFNERIFSRPALNPLPAVAMAPASRPARMVPRSSVADPMASSPAAADPTPNGDQAVALLRLYSALHRQSPRAATVDVVSELSGGEFFEHYYTKNRPVLLKGALTASDAVRRWSPAYFRERFGTVPVEITASRNRDDDYELHFRQTVRTVTLSEFVDRLSTESDTNDFYLVARNYFFDNPALRGLRDELAPPPEIIDTADESPGTAKLWFGPKGTVTPLHFDEHSILFTQVHGRKHFKLIPSFDHPYMYARNTFYSAVDALHVDLSRFPLFQNVSMAEVVVEPGDALFLPVGWWHWARSLDVSISVTFCSFRVTDRNTALRSAGR